MLSQLFRVRRQRKRALPAKVIVTLAAVVTLALGIGAVAGSPRASSSCASAASSSKAGCVGCGSRKASVCSLRPCALEAPPASGLSGLNRCLPR